MVQSLKRKEQNDKELQIVIFKILVLTFLKSSLVPRLYLHVVLISLLQKTKKKKELDNYARFENKSIIKHSK